MSACDVIEVNNELYVHISKVEDLGKLKTENDRLNKLISQREKKWEKWTTEKTILSTKMSDYLCKYQNIKREYTKQIKISTDRKKEIERLNNIINELEEDFERKIQSCTIGAETTTNDFYCRLHIATLKRWLNKIKELKGEDK